MTTTVTKQERLKTNYKRIFIRKPAHVRAQGKCEYTTVSMFANEYTKALQYAFGDAKLVQATVRDIAENLNKKDLLTGDFSLFVRRKALARLKSMHTVQTAAIKLAAENNAAWAGVVNA